MHWATYDMECIYEGGETLEEGQGEKNEEAVPEAPHWSALAIEDVKVAEAPDGGHCF